MSLAEDVAGAQSQALGLPSDARPSGSRRRSTQTTAQADEDSPFIVPRSPRLRPTRSFLSVFRGDGSVSIELCGESFLLIPPSYILQMRAGTQTLIQALQAIPWAEDQDNEDDILHPDTTPTEPESDEDDRAGALHVFFVLLSVADLLN